MRCTGAFCGSQGNETAGGTEAAVTPDRKVLSTCRRDSVNMAQSVPKVRGGVARAFVVQHLKAVAAVRQLRTLLPNDDADQELSLRGANCRPEPERGSGRSGQKPGLAQKGGQAQRDHIGGRALGSARQNSGANRSENSYAHPSLWSRRRRGRINPGKNRRVRADAQRQRDTPVFISRKQPVPLGVFDFAGLEACLAYQGILLVAENSGDGNARGRPGARARRTPRCSSALAEARVEEPQLP